MDSIDYEQANMTLRAGDNPQTVGLRVCLASHNQIPGPFFYVSKWTLQEQEKINYRFRLAKKLEAFAKVNHVFRQYLNSLPANQHIMQCSLVDAIAEMLPNVYLSSMGRPTPVMVLYDNPMGVPEDNLPGFMTPLDAIAAAINKPTPTDN